jgi:hypothetical protein
MAGAAPSPAPARAKREIRVTLFGQPCVLEGPSEPGELQLIHSISPEQIYPNGTPTLAASSAASLKAALAKLEKGGMPAQLDHYRDRLTRRLEAQVAFVTAADAAKKQKKPALVDKAVAQGCKGALKKKAALTSEALESLFEAYNDCIEAEPEEDFHRAIQKMGIQYSCAFDEKEGD